MNKRIKYVLICICVLLLVVFFLNAQNEKSKLTPQTDESGKPESKSQTPQQGESKDKQGGMPQGMPPAKVVVAEITEGLIAPESQFVGTVYYNEVSEVASEIAGKVDSVYFDVGQKVKKGEKLVSLNVDLLEKKLKSSEALFEQALAEIEKAQADFNRMDKLFKEKTVSEQEYDNARYNVKVLEKRANSLKANADQIREELVRQDIKSPFDGIVVEKKIEVGEWLSEGKPVGTIARSDVIDIIVDVPEKILSFVKPEMKVKADVNGNIVNSKIVAIIPKGDTETRTFPIKVRVEDKSEGLVEGMEAKVILPIGEKQNCLTVPRDAVINKFGMNVVFTSDNSIAKMHPVQILGYDGMIAGIQSMDLKKGVKVIVRGNERVQEGQPVEEVQESK
jgi:RND family efflux transporter MFP subunit